MSPTCSRLHLASCFVVLLSLSVQIAVAARSPKASKGKEAAFSNLDMVMEKAVTDGNTPGGVLLVGHDGKIVYRKAFGSRSLEPTREPMTVDTIFDLASL